MSIDGIGVEKTMAIRENAFLESGQAGAVGFFTPKIKDPPSGRRKWVS